MWKLEIYFYVIIFQFFLYLNLGGKGILEQKKVPRFHGFDKTVNPARMFFFSITSRQLQELTGEVTTL